MVNPPSKTADKKDRGSWEPGAPPGFPPQPPPPPLQVPTYLGTQHGSSDTLLNILLGMQQQQQQHITLLQQQMTLLQHQLAAQQQKIELQQPQQQHQQQQITLLQQQMTLIQHQLAAQQQKIELQEPQPQARPSKYFLKLKEAHAPTFAGSRDPLEAEKWITEMEKFCQALCIPMDEWVNATVPFLIADAEVWFISVRPVYESGGARIDWAQFRDIFFLNYFPDTFRTEKESAFFNLKQGNMTVIQYASTFNQLGRFAPPFMVQERCKVTRFEEGLNLTLREYMGTPHATTYQGVLEQALRAERLIAERNQITDSKRPRPWNEHYEETESAANKKAKSANKKAIQEDFDGSTVHGQDDEVNQLIYEETESVAKKKSRSENEKAIQEDLDGSTVHGQADENPRSVPPANSKLSPLPHEFTDYDSHRGGTVVRFRSLEKPKKNEFCLELSKHNNYDEVVQSVARHLSLDDPSKIRLTAHNCFSQHPKPKPIKYRGVEHLKDMLIHHNKTSDILYYEVLDIPLPKLQGLKTLKVAFHYATKDEEVSHTIRLPKQSTVGDVINHLKTKVELSHPNAGLRLLQSYCHKIYKIFPPHEKIENIDDQYWILRAEEIPEEEKKLGPHDRLIHVYHFTKDSTTRNQVMRTFGEPFFLVIHGGETLAEVKSRIQKKLQVSDDEFSKWKFAFVSSDRPKYLEDSDIVSCRFQRRDVYGALEQHLGLEHSDNTPKRSKSSILQFFCFRFNYPNKCFTRKKFHYADLKKKEKELQAKEAVS